MDATVYLLPALAMLGITVTSSLLVPSPCTGSRASWGRSPVLGPAGSTLAQTHSCPGGFGPRPDGFPRFRDAVQAQDFCAGGEIPGAAAMLAVLVEHPGRWFGVTLWIDTEQCEIMDAVAAVEVCGDFE
jgi:hypothetical protein